MALPGIDLLAMNTTHQETLKTLATMADSAQRATDIIGQVLSYARGMDGKRIQVAATSLIRDIEKIIRETFPRNIQIETIVASQGRIPAWFAVRSARPCAGTRSAPVTCTRHHVS